MALSFELVENKYNNRKTSVSNAFLDQLYSIGINKIYNRTYKSASFKQKQLLKELTNNNGTNNENEIKLPHIYNNFVVNNSDNILKKLEANDPDIDFYGNR